MHAFIRFFQIQPHPATTNDPETDPAIQAGSGKANTLGSRDPHVPSKDVADNLEKPKSREEVSASSAQLYQSRVIVVDGWTVGWTIHQPLATAELASCPSCPVGPLLTVAFLCSASAVYPYLPAASCLCCSQPVDAREILCGRSVCSPQPHRVLLGSSRPTRMLRILV